MTTNLVGYVRRVEPEEAEEKGVIMVKIQCLNFSKINVCIKIKKVFFFCIVFL